MINLFGKRIKGNAVEIETGKKYLFIVEADNNDEYTKAVQMVKQSCTEHGIGGIVMNRPMTILDCERLAELEHEQWIYWSKNVYEKIVNLGCEKLASELVTNWSSKWVPYDLLSETDKNEDRVWATKILELK